jgi:UDP:flavonoid glycosyltransferase YjiC (YdhE family)
MRVLMCSTSGRGHFMPLVPFARALRDAGHELLVTAPESAAAMVAGSGMDHWPCADIDRSQLPPVPADDDGAERQRAALAFADLGPQAALPGILAAIDTWHPDVAVLGAARAGVPLVAIPLFADQPDNASRIEATGAGIRVGAGPDGTVDHATLRAAVSRVLTEQEFRDRSRDIARDIAALPPAGDAAFLLEAMASTPRPAGRAG